MKKLIRILEVGCAEEDSSEIYYWVIFLFFVSLLIVCICVGYGLYMTDWSHSQIVSRENSKNVLTTDRTPLITSGSESSLASSGKEC